MKFMVKQGIHVSKERIYKTGEIIESEHDLRQIWPEKFVLVRGEKETRKMRRFVRRVQATQI